MADMQQILAGRCKRRQEIQLTTKQGRIVNITTLLDQSWSPQYIVKWMKKAPGEMQTPLAGCSKAEPKIFAPPQTPFPGAQDGQNLISWRWSLPSPTDPVWWRSMHAISSYRRNRPTNSQTRRPPQTGPITIKSWKSAQRDANTARWL